jgi:hypothetical protein
MPTPVPPTPTAPTPEPTRRRRARPLDSLAILLLGGSACTLSFDALRQVALAAHVRPVLAYLFPIIIDGFIGYGVRAVLLLRDAPPSARRYAWTLFAAASAASLWANALHAIRLNFPRHPHPGPRQRPRRGALHHRPTGPRRRHPPPHPDQPPRPRFLAGTRTGRNTRAHTTGNTGGRIHGASHRSTRRNLRPESSFPPPNHTELSAHTHEFRPPRPTS